MYVQGAVHEVFQTALKNHMLLHLHVSEQARVVFWDVAVHFILGWLNQSACSSGKLAQFIGIWEVYTLDFWHPAITDNNTFWASICRDVFVFASLQKCKLFVLVLCLFIDQMSFNVLTNPHIKP